MPRGSEFHIASYNTAQQFDWIIENAVNTTDVVRGARNDYELLYTRDENGGAGGSLDFKKRLPSTWSPIEWWTRRKQRQQTRIEITRLIDERLGKDFAGVRSWGRTKSMGARLVSDLAPHGFFSGAEIDDEALRKIARTVHALRKEIDLHKRGAPNPNGADGTSLLDASTNRRRKTTFTLRADKLKVLYFRAAELAPAPEGGRPHDPPPEDDSPLDIKSKDASEEMPTPEMPAMAEQGKATDSPLIGPDPRQQDMAVIEEAIDPNLSDEDADEDAAMAGQTPEAPGQQAPQTAARPEQRDETEDKQAADHGLEDEQGQFQNDANTEHDQGAGHNAAAQEDPKTAPNAPSLNATPDRSARSRALRRQDLSNGANLSRGYLPNNGNTPLFEDRFPQMSVGYGDFALSQDYRRGMNGKTIDRDRGAYHLALAAQPGNDSAKDELLETAHNGDPQFMQALAKVYCEGRSNVKQDVEEAAFWLARSWQGFKAGRDHTDWVAALYAASNDDAIPQGVMEHALSKLFLTGNEWVDQNPDKAAYFLLLAVQKGDKQAGARLAELAQTRGVEGDDLTLQLALYRFYRKGGEHIEPDMSRAALWLARAMDDPAGQDGAGNAEPRATLSWLEANVDDPDEDAYMRQLNRGPLLLELNSLYRSGRGNIERNPDKAAYFLVLAASLGAMGAGNEDAAAALKELERENADPAMHYALYDLYRNGADGVERSLFEAGKWLRRTMGLHISTSTDNSHADISRNRAWSGLPTALQKAAENSEPGSVEYALFEAYGDGADGVEQDTGTAVFWLYCGANLGEPRSKAAFNALTWQDYKEFARPFLEKHDQLYWSGGTELSGYGAKLDDAIDATDDPAAYYERAKGWKTGSCNLDPDGRRRPRLDLYAKDLWTAAQNDLPEAQFEMAQLHKGGDNRTDRDDFEYAHWLIRAAANGHVGAQDELAALKIRRSHAQNSQDAVKNPSQEVRMQYALGQVYKQGLYDMNRSVIKPNLKEAIAFTQAALENGYGAAAGTALDALDAQGLPPRPPAQDLRRPLSGVNVNQPAWLPLYRLKLASDIEAMKLRGKMVRDMTPFAGNRGREALQWLGNRGIDMRPLEMVDAAVKANNALIMVMEDLSETGRINGALRQEFEHWASVCRQETNRMYADGHTRQLDKVLNQDRSSRIASAGNRAFDASHIMPNHIRALLEKEADLLQNTMDMTAYVYNLQDSERSIDSDRHYSGTLSQLIRDEKSHRENNGRGEEKATEKLGYEIKARGLWPLADTLGLVNDNNHDTTHISHSIDASLTPHNDLGAQTSENVTAETIIASQKKGVKPAASAFALVNLNDPLSEQKMENALAACCANTPAQAILDDPKRIPPTITSSSGWRKVASPMVIAHYDVYTDAKLAHARQIWEDAKRDFYRHNTGRPQDAELSKMINKQPPPADKYSRHKEYDLYSLDDLDVMIEKLFKHTQRAIAFYQKFGGDNPAHVFREEYMPRRREILERVKNLNENSQRLMRVLDYDKRAREAKNAGLWYNKYSLIDAGWREPIETTAKNRKQMASAINRVLDETDKVLDIMRKWASVVDNSPEDSERLRDLLGPMGYGFPKADWIAGNNDWSFGSYWSD